MIRCQGNEDGFHAEVYYAGDACPACVGMRGWSHSLALAQRQYLVTAQHLNALIATVKQMQVEAEARRPVLADLKMREA